MIAATADLPGSYRIGDGYAYRLATGPTMTFDQAWLASNRIGDRSLADTLRTIDTGATARPGALLAQFAIRWVVVAEDSPFLDVLQAQVDLAERQLQPGVRIFENLAFVPRVGATGWVGSRTTATGPAGDARVRLADNADPGWVPDWRQDGWANSLSAADGEISYRPDGLRRMMAIGSLIVAAAAAVVAWWGREKR
jgi:hypothetical protein